MKKLIPFLPLLVIGCIFTGTNIIVPLDLDLAEKLKIRSGESAWTLEMGPFRSENIQDRPTRFLYTDFRTSDWPIASIEFFMRDEGQANWECYCEYPPEKGPWSPYLRCEFTDLNQPDVKWVVRDSIAYTKGDTIRVKEYFASKNPKDFERNQLMGFTFGRDDKTLGLVDISKPTREYAWIYPYMEPRFQRVIAATSTAMVIKYRKLHLDIVYDHLKIIQTEEELPIEDPGLDEESIPENQDEKN